MQENKFILTSITGFRFITTYLFLFIFFSQIVSGEVKNPDSFISLIAGGGAIRMSQPGNSDRSQIAYESSQFIDSYQIIGAIIDAHSYNSITERPVSPGKKSPGIKIKRGFFFHARLGIFFNQGNSLYNRQNEDLELMQMEEKSPPVLTILPGANLFLGFSFCPEIHCSVMLGRTEHNSSFLKNLSGNSGPVSGLHFNFKDATFGKLFLSPIYRPSLSGNSYLLTSSKNPADFSYADRDQEEQLLHAARGFNDYAHRMEYTGGPEFFKFSFFYRIINARDRDENVFTNKLENYGFGIGTQNIGNDYIFESYISISRSIGYYHIPVSYRERAKELRIDGIAIRSGVHFQILEFNIKADIFLPEPATLSRGSLATDEEKSGYVLSGQNPIKSPLLLRTLSFIPAPVLCTKASCSGLQIREGDAGFKNHAALFSLQSGYVAESASIALQMEFMQPIRPREQLRKMPFDGAKKKKSLNYLEISFILTKDIFKAGNIALQYARLLKTDPEEGRLILAEGIYFSMEYYF